MLFTERMCPCDHTEGSIASKETQELHKQRNLTPREQILVCLSSHYIGRQSQKPNDIFMDHGHSNTCFFLG